jgi:hypothetical protein
VWGRSQRLRSAASHGPTPHDLLPAAGAALSQDILARTHALKHALHTWKKARKNQGVEVSVAMDDHVAFCAAHEKDGSEFGQWCERHRLINAG